MTGTALPRTVQAPFLGPTISAHDSLLALLIFVCAVAVTALTLATAVNQQNRDIREREWAEKRFRLVVESAPNGVVMINAEGSILMVNAQTERMFGFDRQELLGKPVELLVPDRLREAHPGHRQRFLDNPATRLMGAGRDLYGRRRDGSEFPVEIGLTPIDTGEGIVILSAIVDISDRKCAEEELRQARARLESTQEDQRKRLARELHDEMGQHITALMLGLQALKPSLPNDAAQERLRQLMDLTDELGREVHRIAWELRPTSLDDVGLASTLAIYLQQWSERARIPVDFQPVGLDRERLPPTVETTMYRLVQEALTNVLKHAQAQRVSVILESREQRLTAIVEDDGRGFDPEKVLNVSGRRRFGLLGMKERLDLVAGAMHVESAPSKGTTLYVYIPLRNGVREE